MKCKQALSFERFYCKEVLKIEAEDNSFWENDLDTFDIEE